MTNLRELKILYIENELRKVYNQEIKRIKPILNSFLNQKIEKTNSYKTLKFENAIKPIFDKNEIIGLFNSNTEIYISRIYYKIDYDTLFMDITLKLYDRNKEEFWRTSHKNKSFQIGRVEKQKLVNIQLKEEELLNIVNEIALFNICEEKKAELYSLKSNLFYGLRELL